MPRERWSGLTHPGRLRFQTFRPGHGEPLTDALIGQGMMALGGGGYGGGGLPYPSDVLQLWGGMIEQAALPTRSSDRGQGRRLGEPTTTPSLPSAPRDVARSPLPRAGPEALRPFDGIAFLARLLPRRPRSQGACRSAPHRRVPEAMDRQARAGRCTEPRRRRWVSSARSPAAPWFGVVSSQVLFNNNPTTYRPRSTSWVGLRQTADRPGRSANDASSDPSSTLTSEPECGDARTELDVRCPISNFSTDASWA